MEWGTKECDEYNMELKKEIYDEKIKQYNELKKWIKAYDTSIEK